MKKLFFLLFALPFMSPAGTVSVTSVTAQQRYPVVSPLECAIRGMGWWMSP